MSKFIKVRGARTNCLQDVSVDIPCGKLVVISGRSGSGKSSLAIDTIFAEGQRQFLECQSLYSRQFVGQYPRADVDSVEGLPATVCCTQQNRGGSPRSTVGTLTEIHDFLRLLYARVGVVHCPGCGKEVRQKTPAEIADQVEGFAEGTRVMIATPLASEKNFEDQIRAVRRQGLLRVQIDGAIFDIDELPPGNLNPESVSAIVDRIIVRDDIRERLLKAIDVAAEFGGGQVWISHVDPASMEGDASIKSDPSRWSLDKHSTRYACGECEIEFSEVSPRLFSFNTAEGACRECEGLGLQLQFAVERLVDRKRSLADGAVVPWRELSASGLAARLKGLGAILDRCGFSVETNLSDVLEEAWGQFLNSTDKDAAGLFAVLRREIAITDDDDWYETLCSFEAEMNCEGCGGARLNRDANSVRFCGATPGELLSMPLDELADWFSKCESDFDGDAVEREAVSRIVGHINQRLECLTGMGISYLTLSRAADSLSGGELQRVRMCASLGSGLTGACYVLDEPSVGLHSRDSLRLEKTIRGLVDNGNSLIVVEHDTDLIRKADHVIDLGPGAGRAGGRVVAEGRPDELAAIEQSPTGEALASDVVVPVPQRRSVGDDARWLKVVGAEGFNLKKVDVRFPLGRLVCVSGVSGSGKSTLVNRTLGPALADHFGFFGRRPEPFSRLEGAEQIDKAIVVDQKPIGRSARSCPATFCGLLDPIRKLFSMTKLAKQRGFGIGRFSFNAKAGRCSDCLGHGYRQVKLDFMPGALVACETCRGGRYNRQTLAVRFGGLSMADVLELTVDEAREQFSEITKVMRTLDVMSSVGLGYLKLGQPAMTLSGGESQRLKLAKELSRAEDAHTLYLLDEPTRGLHVLDVRELLLVLQGLVEKGHSVIVIEHHLDMLKSADWLIDLGPDGGEAGGHVVAEGTPEDVAANEESLTGKFLRPLL